MGTLDLHPLQLYGLTITRWRPLAANCFEAAVLNQPNAVVDALVQLLGPPSYPNVISATLYGVEKWVKIDAVRYLNTGEGIEISGEFVAKPLSSTDATGDQSFALPEGL